MRTTIRMKLDLARRAKRYAAQRGQTFTQIVELAVAEYLNRSVPEQPRPRITLPTAGDPANRMSEAQYRAAVDAMHDEDLAPYDKALHADPRR